MTAFLRQASRGVAHELFLVISIFLIVAYPVRARSAEVWQTPLKVSEAAQQRAGLTYVKLRHGSLRAQISAMATVMQDAGRTVVFRPAGDGKISEVKVIPGQRVKKGSVLATYQDHSLHTVYFERAQAAATLASAKAACAEAERSYQRGVALKGSTVARSEVERRWAILQEQRASCAAAQASMDIITHRLKEEFSSSTEVILHGETSQLIAPMDGVVQSVNLAVDDDLKSGTAVLTLVDLTHVWIVARIRPQDAATIEIGGTVVARPSGSPAAQPIIAKITTIDGITDPATGLLSVTSIVDNRAGSLRPGEMLDALLCTNVEAEGLVVPIEALQTIDGHDVVFVQDGKERFQPHPVTRRLETDKEVIVDGDLTPGATIVAQGSFALKGIALLSPSGDY